MFIPHGVPLVLHFFSTNIKNFSYLDAPLGKRKFVLNKIVYPNNILYRKIKN